MKNILSLLNVAFLSMTFATVSASAQTTPAATPTPNARTAPRAKTSTPSSAQTPAKTQPDTETKELGQGEISKGRYITGGVVGSVVGLGIGHGIQGGGRYIDNGWIFTATESAALTVLAIGAVNSCHHADDYNTDNNHWNCHVTGAEVGGYLAFIGLHIWEVIDLWVTPNKPGSGYRVIGANQPAPPRLLVGPTVVKNTPGLALNYSF